ncbi:MAG: hypothetical protein JWQ03_3153 [Variovorax sp.]|nr:hypothetical protein [Variovorax sp.]
MPEQIIPIADIKARAAEAFADDQPICTCPYPFGSEARAIWLSEYAALSNQSWVAA